MAYTCILTGGGECTGCMDCRPEDPPETGVVVEATIKLKFTSYGEIERILRSGDKKCAEGMAEAIIDDILDCCGKAGEDMTCESFTMELNE